MKQFVKHVTNNVFDRCKYWSSCDLSVTETFERLVKWFLLLVEIYPAFLWSTWFWRYCLLMQLIYSHPCNAIATGHPCVLLILLTKYHKKYHKKLYKTINKSPLLEEKRYKYSDLSFYLYPSIVEEISNSSYLEFLQSNFSHKRFNPHALFHI